MGKKIDLAKAYDLIGLPPIQREVRLREIPDVCPHKAVVEDWADRVVEMVQGGRNLLLWGDFGVGKSGCAAILLKAALSHGVFGYWITADEYVGAVMNDAMWGDGQTVDDRAKTVPLLVLDELILREVAKQKETMVEMLVRHRLENLRSMIITTNHSPSQIREYHQSFDSLFTGHFDRLNPRGKNFRG